MAALPTILIQRDGLYLILKFLEADDHYKVQSHKKNALFSFIISSSATDLTIKNVNTILKLCAMAQSNSVKKPQWASQQLKSSSE